MTLKDKIYTLARNHDLLSKRHHMMVAKCYGKIEGTGHSDYDISDYLYDYEIHACRVIYDKYKDKIDARD